MRAPCGNGCRGSCSGVLHDGGCRRLRPALAANERVLAWATVADDQAVVVTNLGLHLPDRTERLGWHEIHKATWTGRELIIVPGEVREPDAGGYQVVADLPPVTIPLSDPGDVPKVVWARVTKSVSFSAHEAVPGRGLGVARRVPGWMGCGGWSGTTRAPTAAPGCGMPPPRWWPPTPRPVGRNSLT